jgi:hypothetical protein
MPVAWIWRRMLEHTWNQPDHLRCVHRQEGRRRPAEVMNAHVLSELGDDPRTNNGIQPARAHGGFLI